MRTRILAETRGNPLALLELPREFSAGGFAGGFGLPRDGSLPGRIEASFRRRVEQLPAQTQRLLLLAAADPTGEARSSLSRVGGDRRCDRSAGSRRNRRAARAGRVRQVSPSAAALRDLSGGGVGRSARRPSGAGGGHRSRFRPRSPGLASRARDRRRPMRTSRASWSSRPGAPARGAGSRRPLRSSSDPRRSRPTRLVRAHRALEAAASKQLAGELSGSVEAARERGRRDRWTRWIAPGESSCTARSSWI